jgi:hypothetical protein
MSLLREIQDAAASDEVSVTTLLRKTKILATRLKHEPLQRWVDRELEGYGPEDALPEYRQLRNLDVKADFSGPFNSGLRNANVPPACIDADMREYLFSADNRQGIAAVDDLLRSDEGAFTSPWPANAVVRYADSVYEHMGMMHAWRVIPRGAVVGIVDGVRNRLLSFALELEQLAPDAGEQDRSASQPGSAQLTQIFNSTIYGGQAIIAGGNVDRTTMNVTMLSTWPQLRETLEALGVPEEELLELHEALESDNGAGRETQSWIGRLAAKVGTGAISLGSGVTTEIVAGEIAKAAGLS